MRLSRLSVTVTAAMQDEADVDGEHQAREDYELERALTRSDRLHTADSV
jgi:hypothetical protein